MRLKLTNRDAQRMLGALKTIEVGGENKLSAQTRMTIAININRLMPVVAAFETGGQKRQLDFQQGPEFGESNRAIQKELIELGDAAQEHDLLRIPVSELKLDENPKITGDQIASLAPILKGLEEAVPEAA